jgi:hypothetical protein
MDSSFATSSSVPAQVSDVDNRLGPNPLTYIPNQLIPSMSDKKRRASQRDIQTNMNHFPRQFTNREKGVDSDSGKETQYVVAGLLLLLLDNNTWLFGGIYREGRKYRVVE